MKSATKGGICTIKDEIIPSRSQVLLQAQVNMVGNILAVPLMLESGLSVANSVAQVESNTIPVVVLNPFNKEVKIGSGTKLASAELLNEAKVSESEEKLAINKVIMVPQMKETLQVGDGLTSEQVEQLSSLINDHIQASSLDSEIGQTSVQTHKIELLPNPEPVVEPLRRRAQIQVEETRRQVKQLLKEGKIEESASPWASAYVLAKKKNGEYRLCIDFRRLNDVTKKMVYPLPNIDECLETLSGKRYFTQLDFRSGFWQIAMDESSKELTAFRTGDGLYQFKRMPFGLTNAPATFQKMINTVLAGLKGMNLQVFIDDVCIATKSWSELLAILQQTLETIIDANLKIKADKCVFSASTIKFLGYEISEQVSDKIRRN